MKTVDNKCRAASATMRTSLVRALSLSVALALGPVMTPVVAADYRPVAPPSTEGQSNARFLSLGVGKSIVVDLPRDIKDVLVADPKIANAVVRSAQRAYIIGAAVGIGLFLALVAIAERMETRRMGRRRVGRWR